MRSSGRCLALSLLLSVLAPLALGADRLAIRVKAAHLGDGTVVENALILIAGGKIVAVAAGGEVPAGTEELKFEGAQATPGFIDANAVAGMPSRFSWNEQSGEVIPQMRVLDALDLRSRDFENLARSGVTCAFIGPDGGSVIGPRGTIVKTAGPIGQRVVTPESAVKAVLGREPEFRGSSNNTPSRFFPNTFIVRRPTTRMGTVWVFRKAFYKSLAVIEGSELKDNPKLSGDPATGDEEAVQVLARVVKGEIPLRIQARALNDIETAVRLAHEFRLKFVLEEGLEAYRFLDVLKAEKIPVIFGPLYTEASGARSLADDAGKPCLTTPALLVKAGIPVALSAVDLAPEQDLRQQATFAVRYGMPEKEALKSITSVPAELLGLGSRMGQLKAGMDADLVVWSGDVFSLETRPLCVVVNGQVVFTNS